MLTCSLNELNSNFGFDTKLIDGVPHWSERGADTWFPFKSGYSLKKYLDFINVYCNMRILANNAVYTAVYNSAGQKTTDHIICLSSIPSQCKYERIYTNSGTTQFESQKINLDLKKYDGVIIVMRFMYDQDSYSTQYNICFKDLSTMAICDAISNREYGSGRNIIATDSGVVVGDGIGLGKQQGNGAMFAIPISIYGFTLK